MTSYWRSIFSNVAALYRFWDIAKHSSKIVHASIISYCTLTATEQNIIMVVFTVFKYEYIGLHRSLSVVCISGNKW